MNSYVVQLNIKYIFLWSFCIRDTYLIDSDIRFQVIKPQFFAGGGGTLHMDNRGISFGAMFPVCFQVWQLGYRFVNTWVLHQSSCWLCTIIFTCDCRFSAFDLLIVQSVCFSLKCMFFSACCAFTVRGIRFLRVFVRFVNRFYKYGYMCGRSPG